VTPAEVLGARAFDPFCERGVLATIDKLADFSHSKAMADLVSAGKWRTELLITLGKVGPPRYANFIGRYKDDADDSVRRAVATALGSIDNEAVSVPVLVRLLTRGDPKTDFGVRWEAASSLATLARRKPTGAVPRRLHELSAERDPVTAVLAARALASAGDARGLGRLRDLATHADPLVRQEALLALGEVGDKGVRAIATARLKDDSLAVRAAAVYALGQMRDPSVVSTLRKAVEESLDYEKRVEGLKARGESEATLHDRYGLGEFDLRQTLEEAIQAAQAR
jgi:HEAT repeat protein